MTDIVEQAARVLYEHYRRSDGLDVTAQESAEALTDAGLLRDPARTVPTREEIGEVVCAKSHYDGNCGCGRDDRTADAILALLAGQPTVAEAKAEAWEEGARAAWLRTGEGWNGEYAEGTHDGSRSFRDCNPDTPNPYRTQDGK